MIPVKKLSYDLKENPELAFTRLRWAVEPVGSLFSQMITNATVATTRPWVGVLEKDTLEFELLLSQEGLLVLGCFSLSLLLKERLARLKEVVELMRS